MPSIHLLPLEVFYITFWNPLAQDPIVAPTSPDTTGSRGVAVASSVFLDGIIISNPMVEVFVFRETQTFF